MDTVTGQLTSESFWGRVISVDPLRVPRNFSIPVAGETDKPQSAIRPDRNDESGHISHTDMRDP